MTVEAVDQTALESQTTGSVPNPRGSLTVPAEAYGSLSEHGRALALDNHTQIKELTMQIRWVVYVRYGQPTAVQICRG